MTKPFSFDTTTTSFSSILDTPEFVSSFDGTQLAYYPFINPSSIATIVFYHGGGLWSTGLYQHMAQELCDKYNITTYLFDIRGHGNSDGSRGDTPQTKSVWQDIDIALDLVRRKHSNIPLFLSGHSAGAGVILNYASWKGDVDVDGYLFLAPFLGVLSPATRYSSKKFISRIKILPLIVSILSQGKFFNNEPAVFFNFPEAMKLDNKILDYYTYAMVRAVTPINPSKQFAALGKMFGLFIGSDDELFRPHKTISYEKHAQQQIKKSSVAEIIEGETHLSIVVAASKYISSFVDRFKNIPLI